MNYIDKFSEKAEHYAKTRPGYPIEIVELLKKLGQTDASAIADIGAGTGLLTKVLAKCGCTVYAVEPNAFMMDQCKKHCESEKNVKYLLATAEKTTLPDNSLDFITVAQAFHWFNKEACKPEFKRVLKKTGCVLLVWLNYENISEFETEYERTIARYRDEDLDKKYRVDHHAEKMDFFGTPYEVYTIPYSKSYNRERLQGLALSLSYAPKKGDPLYERFLDEINALFDKYNEKGEVTYRYCTEISVCRFI